MRQDSVLYKAISCTGQLAIKAVERGLTLFIKEKGNVIDPGNFPWVRVMEQHVDLIIQDLHHVLADYSSIPNFDDLSPEQKRIVRGEQWKSFMLYTYGARIESNIRRCPDTDRLLKGIPGMTTAFFSILEPQTTIAPHRGPYKGVLRYHLGLIIPADSKLCGIKIGSDTYHWETGKSLIFDDTIIHEAWNNSTEIRVVLFVDFKRSYPFPISVFNDVMVWLIRISPFIAGIVEKAEQAK